MQQISSRRKAVAAARFGQLPLKPPHARVHIIMGTTNLQEREGFVSMEAKL